MTPKTLTGACLLALAAALAASGSGASAAGLAGKSKVPEDLEISERATAPRARTGGTPPELSIHDGGPVAWTVSGVGTGGDLPAGELPSETSVTSRLGLDTAVLDLSWVCTVQIPRAGAEQAAHGDSTLYVGMPLDRIVPRSPAALPSKVELEWTGSGELPAHGLGLAVVRSMLGSADGPHAGRLEGRAHWRDGTSITASREWGDAETEGGSRTGLGLRRSLAGAGWELDAGVDVGSAREGHAATESLVLDAAGRIVALPGAAVTMSARYERRWGSDEGQQSIAVEFGADLTDVISTNLPWLAEPRFRMEASAQASTPGHRPRPMRLQEVRGAIEVGWRF